ncbi:hypothetical protein QFC21_003534 [Naganishia friedmannii]|uniref:Uncharacterized protein n=1 Tax=Naganishia friedmannii TaxID=89922 RepID=A0ACC2VM53_9TREE|nr:hypothetical protein QFC21_003534 [Naganishia friedmannii]
MAYQTRTTTGSLKRSSNHINNDHSSSSSSGDDDDDERQADPDFLALSRRQRRAVDKAFRNALRDVKRKRRRVDTTGATTSGGGGFVDEDSAGGGFIADADEESGGGGGGGGGFLASPSPPTTTATTITAHHSEPPTDDFLPYSALPGVFASLGLQWDDDVLATLKGLSAASRAPPQQQQQAGEARPDETSWGMHDNYVDLHDFRSVCGVLMMPEEEGAGAGAGAGGEADAAMDDAEDDADDAEDAYAEDEEMDTSSDLSDPDHQPAAADNRRRTRKPAGRRPSPGAEIADLRLPAASENAAGYQQRKLSREEKDWVARMWDTLFTGTTLGRGESARLLGKEQVKSWAERLGMQWSEQELREMIELFSTQPGKRGLGFDDFCNLLIQGGML